MVVPLPAIAIVDDEPAVSVALGRVLRLSGFLTELFAESALFLADRRVFDCVILDLNLPGLDGFGVLEALASRPIRPAVVVVTARHDPESAARAVQLGASACLAKPVETALLLRAIATAMGAGPKRG